MTYNPEKYVVEIHTAAGYVFNKSFSEEATATRCYTKHEKLLNWNGISEIRMWHGGKCIIALTPT
jgi:hypothetical protein